MQWIAGLRPLTQRRLEPFGRSQEHFQKALRDRHRWVRGGRVWVAPRAPGAWWPCLSRLARQAGPPRHAFAFMMVRLHQFAAQDLHETTACSVVRLASLSRRQACRSARRYRCCDDSRAFGGPRPWRRPPLLCDPRPRFLASRHFPWS